MVSKEQEQDLIRQCREGNEDAFAELISLYKPRILSLCHKIVKDHEIAEDLTQEAFLRSYRKLDTFRGDSRFYTWLYRIAFNLTINYLKKKRRLQERELKEHILTKEQGRKAVKRMTRFIPLEVLDQNEMKELLQEALIFLSPTHRDVFILYVLRGIPQKTIAKVMEINYGTVRSRLHYARKEIIEFLKYKKL